MSDLIIRNEDGWIEITDVMGDLGESERGELWTFIGQGNMENAASLLDMELGAELQDLIGTASIVGVKAVEVPDDVLGRHLRVWIMVEK